MLRRTIIIKNDMCGRHNFCRRLSSWGPSRVLVVLVGILVVLQGTFAGLRLSAFLILSLFLEAPVDRVTVRLPAAGVAGSRSVTPSTGAAKTRERKRSAMRRRPASIPGKTTRSGKRPRQDDKKVNKDDDNDEDPRRGPTGPSLILTYTHTLVHSSMSSRLRCVNRA